MGYSRAGFDVVGVDIAPQPRYPFAFVEMDALEVLRVLLAGNAIVDRGGRYWRMADFGAIHASPPCQAYTRGNRVHKHTHPELVEPVRDLLIATGKPYVIENVEFAPLRASLLLCGTMFGLSTRRHRLFESNTDLGMSPFACRCAGQTVNGKLLNYHNTRDRNLYLSMQDDNGATAFRKSLGVEWMTFDGSQEAIPPAYTEFIGRHLLAALEPV